MSKQGEEIAARARALVGVRFRPQGRSPDTGVDCIGVVALALQLGSVRCDYMLHGGAIETLDDALREAGLRKVRKAQIGDVLVLKAGAEQLHMAIVTDAGFVHAHAGLRRVVETPGRPEWPLVGIWRMRSCKWQR
jgi:cell wall-associated NlpC family hydrolase